ncbi:MAG: hypothetical protein C0582_02930 [Alphaproteobacteria bacterium]|nr:MAG: hypothetical protein C0582_02930 [Alphaproteobacteria bacterium]
MRPHPIDLNDWQADFFSFQEQISLQGMGQIQRTIEGDRVYLGPLKTQPLYRVDITFETQRFNPALQVSQGDEIDLTLTQSWQDAKGDLRSEDSRTWPRRHWHQGSLRIVTATSIFRKCRTRLRDGLKLLLISAVCAINHASRDWLKTCS